VGADKDDGVGVLGATGVDAGAAGAAAVDTGCDATRGAAG
jgi:hypothetical protein